METIKWIEQGFRRVLDGAELAQYRKAIHAASVELRCPGVKQAVLAPLASTPEVL